MAKIINVSLDGNEVCTIIFYDFVCMFGELDVFNNLHLLDRQTENLKVKYTLSVYLNFLTSEITVTVYSANV